MKRYIDFYNHKRRCFRPWEQSMTPERWGRIVEHRPGSLATLGLYLCCAVAGGLFIMWKTSNHPKPGVSLGASAAVSGLLRCALVLLHRPSAADFGWALWVRVVLWAILVFGLVVSFLPGVSLSGHIGGLALGALFGFLVPVRTGDPARSSMQGIRQTNGPSKNRARRGLKKKPLTFPPKALVEDQTRGYTSSSFGSTSSMVTGLFEY